MALSEPGIEPRSPTLQADSLPSEPPGKPLKDVHDGSSGRTQVIPDGHFISRQINEEFQN